MKTALVVLVMAMTAMPATGQAPAVGEIAGRITDCLRGAVPGVRITVSTDEEQREMLTDAGGEFLVSRLRFGTYRVTAALTAFVPVSGVVTLSPDARRVDLTWSLELFPISEFQLVTARPVEVGASIADAIVRFRVRSEDGLRESAPSDCKGWTTRGYTVDVVQSVPRPGRQGDGRTTFDVVRAHFQTPLKPGEEYLALVWHRGRISDVWEFPIVSGRIASSERKLNGLRAEEAWETLLGWLRGQKP